MDWGQFPRHQKYSPLLTSDYRSLRRHEVAVFISVEPWFVPVDKQRCSLTVSSYNAWRTAKFSVSRASFLRETAFNRTMAVGTHLCWSQQRRRRRYTDCIISVLYTETPYEGYPKVRVVPQALMVSSIHPDSVHERATLFGCLWHTASRQAL